MRLIDADVLLERLRDLDEWCRDARKMGIEQAMCIVQEQPTAYDVDTVLDGIKETYECNECNNKSCGINYDGYVCQDVFDIVKRGGVDKE